MNTYVYVCKYVCAVYMYSTQVVYILDNILDVLAGAWRRTPGNLRN